MIRLPSTALVAAALVVLGACSHADNYKGDGVLIDRGPLAATDRYILELGSVDLSKEGRHKFRVEGLPAEEFVVGLLVGTEIRAQTLSPTLEIRLTDQAGAVIFSRRGTLAEWTWSETAHEPEAFVYARNPNGSFFQPPVTGEQILEISVSNPLAMGPMEARLVAKSGGWK
jgi:hypothetical protein